jgi:CheY-like chemotaxis protein
MAGLGVLIVDDNWLFLEAARDRLEREGLRVVGVAASSAEALRRVEELRPEVVLVDLMLGSESGFELARRLAAHHRDGNPFPAIPSELLFHLSYRLVGGLARVESHARDAVAVPFGSGALGVPDLWWQSDGEARRGQ